MAWANLQETINLAWVFNIRQQISGGASHLYKDTADGEARQQFGQVQPAPLNPLQRTQFKHACVCLCVRACVFLTLSTLLYSPCLSFPCPLSAPMQRQTKTAKDVKAEQNERQRRSVRVCIKGRERRKPGDERGEEVSHLWSSTVPLGKWRCQIKERMDRQVCALLVQNFRRYFRGVQPDTIWR